MSEQKIYSVQPIPLAIVNGFRISRIELSIEINSATIYVDLMNDFNIVCQKSLLLDGEDYINWGANQPYLNNWICSKLNMSVV